MLKYICRKIKNLLTFGQEASLYQPRLHHQLGQQETERDHNMEHHTRGTRVAPERLQHRGRCKTHATGRVHTARAQGLADLEAVVGQVADLEDGRGQEEWDQYGGATWWCRQ